MEEYTVIFRVQADDLESAQDKVYEFLGDGGKADAVLTGDAPYKQGFHPLTSDIVIVCSVEDVQYALRDETGWTISRPRAIELMQEHEEALTYAYHHGWNGEWSQSIQDVLSQHVTDSDRVVYVCTCGAHHPSREWAVANCKCGAWDKEQK